MIKDKEICARTLARFLCREGMETPKSRGVLQSGTLKENTGYLKTKGSKFKSKFKKRRRRVLQGKALRFPFVISSVLPENALRAFGRNFWYSTLPGVK